MIRSKSLQQNLLTRVRVLGEMLPRRRRIGENSDKERAEIDRDIRYAILKGWREISRTRRALHGNEKHVALVQELLQSATPRVRRIARLLRKESAGKQAADDLERELGRLRDIYSGYENDFAFIVREHAPDLLVRAELQESRDPLAIFVKIFSAGIALLRIQDTPRGYVANRPSYGFEIFHHAKAYYESAIDDLRKAEKSIFVEMYIWAPDSVGMSFAETLARKAEEGLLVIAVIDAFGSSSRLSPATQRAFNRMVGLMRSKGVDVRFFNPPMSAVTEYSAFTVLRHPIVSFFGRNHRKLIVIDRKIAYFGGMNLSEDYYRYRDCHMRITGEPIMNLLAGFRQTLYLTKEYGRRSLDALRERRSRDEQALNVPKQRMSYRIVTNSPSLRDHSAREEYLRFINLAKKSIFIMNAYFVPGWRVTRALMDAARRGVDVRIILSRKSDSFPTDHAAKVFLLPLLNNGVKVYFYEKEGVDMIHAKIMSVDGKYATIGSSNFDYVSISLNYELNIFFADNSIARNIEEHFLADIAYCIKATENNISPKSIKERSMRLLSYGVVGAFLKQGAPPHLC